MSYDRTCIGGIVYGRAGGEELLLDLYLPDRAEAPAQERNRPLACVVYFHGGGWVSGSREGGSSSAFALEMAAEGLAVASVDYRPGPAHPAPAAIEDAKLAVRWVRANAARYGIDPNRLAAMGYSAGGHLAAMLGVTRPGDGFEGEGLPGVSSGVAAVVDLCGISDIAALLAMDPPPDWADAWIPRRLADRRGFAMQCSPVRYAHPGAAPMLICHGDADESVPFAQSVTLDEAMRAAGAECELVSIPGEGHALGIMGPAKTQRTVREARRAFFKRVGLV